ncbi:hypothetical protein M431DRAFT_511621 [Trichoderma harzianum CBS 226.95]|uniref:Uncharacterized protein n=1 Tax=Trichoderma harzianum CBS 226.95 TaxID=983964 RepID=A0A2T4A0Z3_TRIHA|nr:hypothetical protein M431DRAFT_511621 [Trichoderma harzianum CBS 226.95]PTB50698.1 hypothetical protein M431DRAFT_511621 [Trichoderma harzianum CBS 226.95]
MAPTTKVMSSTHEYCPLQMYKRPRDTLRHIMGSLLFLHQPSTSGSIPGESDWTPSMGAGRHWVRICHPLGLPSAWHHPGYNDKSACTSIEMGAPRGKIVGFSASLVQPLLRRRHKVHVRGCTLYGRSRSPQSRRQVAQGKAERISPPSAVGKEGGKNVGRRSSVVGEARSNT